MGGILDALIDQQADGLLLTRETTRAWPFVRPLFDAGGYFPGGLTIHAPKIVAAAEGTTVSGTTLIDGVSFPVDARLTGSGAEVDLVLTLGVTLAALTGDGSALRAEWQPAVVFRSDGGKRSLSLDAARGTVHLGDFVLKASLVPSTPRPVTRLNTEPAARSRLAMTVPGPMVVATLRPEGQPLPLSAATGLHAPAAVGPGLTLAELRLTVDPWAGEYGVEVEAGGDWEVVPGATLTGVAASILYSAEARAADVALRATVTLGSVPVRVEAVHDAGVSGWQFEGGLVPGGVLGIGAFIDALLRQLGATARCPDALRGATISELSATFNTATQAFAARAVAGLPLGEERTLDLVLVVAVESGHARFEGTATLGGLEFDLLFDGTAEGMTLVARFSDASPARMRLGDILSTVLDDGDARHGPLIELGNKASFAVREALFVLARRHGAPAAWLLAADVEAGVDLSGLPLVGASFPPGEGARLLLQPLLGSGGVGAADLAVLAGDGGLRLPDPLPAASGFSLTTRLALGAEEIRLGLPLGMGEGQVEHAPDLPAEPPPPEVTRIDEVSWVAVQKAYGPLALERLGVRFRDGGIDLLLDAHLAAGGLSLALEGLGVRVPLADPAAVTLQLDGMGLDFRSPGFELGGSLLHQRVGTGEAAWEEYFGTVVVRAGALSVDALGSYREIEGHPSLFVHAALDYPIGGPAFFFVTGLSAAFGYNRALKLPPIDRLADFPLLAANAGRPADDPAADPAAKGPAAALRAMGEALRAHIPAELGAVFLGVGVKFDTFRTISSSALLSASFGKELSLDLIGRSTLLMPAGAPRERAVAVVEMAWLAAYRPAEGLLALRAQLSPGSWVFARDCALAGGFALHAWFSGERAGEFVLTAGGYHPAFDLASRPHFPRVPRLSLGWQVNPALSIKGDAYFALTTGAAMAGGHLEMVWDQHPYRAWCKAGIDCLFEWQPLHYRGEAYVELGASYTFELGGTRHLTIEAGAALTVWGPPFSGRARVDCGLFSFDMVFGSPAAKPPPVHLHDEDGHRTGGGFSALLPEPGQICTVTVADGLTRVREGRTVWVVNAQALRLVVDSAIPAKEILVPGMARDPDDPAGDAPSRFGIAPMEKGDAEVTSGMTITATKLGDAGWTPEHLRYRLRRKGFPPALWGEPGQAGRAGGPALVDAVCGVEIVPAGTADTGLSVTHEGVRFLERRRPALRDGTYDIQVTQRLATTPGTAAHGETCCRPLEATASLRVEVAAEEASLPAACVHSVFPPQGSLGDHANSLPQIILTRSTLPWEHRAEVTGADGNTPWLALLVFDGEKKAEPGAPREGLPGPARIAVAAKDLPSARDLGLLCHVRAMGGTERAVVLANRLPAPGGLSTVHLVSLRGIEAAGEERRLVSLRSWTFSCPASGAGFRAMAEGLAAAPISPAGVRLPHALASGERAEATYRGPFVPPAPGAVGAAPGLPDVSQLAALELGRLLALRDRAVAVGLLRLKRGLAREARQAGQRRDAPHLHPAPRPAAAAALSAAPSADGGLLPAGLRRLLTPELAAWAEGLLRLEGVPFRYLLPDEALLPKESVRSFALDRQWLTNLLLGALGVGGAWDPDAVAVAGLPGLADACRPGQGPAGPGEEPCGPLPAITGLVMRSALVSGWPAMAILVEGGRAPLACRRLGKTILLALFEGPLEGVRLRLPQETLHLEARGPGRTLPPDWLAAAKSSVHLGRHVGFAAREEVPLAGLGAVPPAGR